MTMTVEPVATTTVRDFTGPELEAFEPGFSYAALDPSPGPVELVMAWPAVEPEGWWWVGTIDGRRGGRAQFTSVPVRASEIGAVLHIMRTDASLLTWNAKPCQPLTKNPYAPDGKPPVPVSTPATVAVQSWVYFIRAGESGPIKIGTAKDPRRRLAGLQTSTAVPLHILAAMAGDRTAEQRLHQRFQHLRLRGEWFVPEPELLEYIRQEAQPWER